MLRSKKSAKDEEEEDAELLQDERCLSFHSCTTHALVDRLIAWAFHLKQNFDKQCDRDKAVLMLKALITTNPSLDSHTIFLTDAVCKFHADNSLGGGADYHGAFTVAIQLSWRSMTIDISSLRRAAHAVPPNHKASQLHQLFLGAPDLNFISVVKHLSSKPPKDTASSSILQQIVASVGLAVDSYLSDMNESALGEDGDEDAVVVKPSEEQSETVMQEDWDINRIT